MQPILQISNMQVSLPSGGDRAFAVRDVSLSIAAGQTLCVVGESGSGKSVMSLAVMGLLDRALRLSGGTIQLAGEFICRAPQTRLRALRGAAMGMVFQEPMTALNPVLSCGAQLDELLREHTPLGKEQRRNKIIAMFERVRLPEPERIFTSFPHQLSGGQRQRIVIAMAVILQPKLLICDEPTTALDVTTQKEILALIAGIQAEHGSAVLFITHDMGVVADIADAVLVMRAGEAVESGASAEVLYKAKHDYTRMLLASVPSMTPPGKREAPNGEVLLRASAVDKTYSQPNGLFSKRHTVALQDASLALHRGETVGVVGESGSGKSTLARCLIRLLAPSKGHIHWGEHEVATLSEGALRPLRNQVQVIFQDPNRSLNPRQRIAESLMEGAINFGATHEEARSAVVKLLELVRLPQSALARYPSEFSGGQRQRLAIARALACKPKVLIADEAVSALDVSVQAQVMQLLRDVQAELGLAMLFITHDLRVAAQLCDRVIVMHQGRIVEQGETAALYANPQQEYTQRLFAAAPSFVPSLVNNT